MPGKRRGRSKANQSPTHPMRIEARERHAHWAEQRKAGMPITVIAAEAGVSHSTVSEAISKLMRELPAEDAAALREMENQRLDHTLSRIWPLLDSTEPVTVCNAADRVVRLSKRRSEINGTDRPAQAAVGPDGKPVSPQINVYYHEEPVRE